MDTPNNLVPNPENAAIPHSGRRYAAIGCALVLIALGAYGFWLLRNAQTQVRIASGGNDIWAAANAAKLYARDHDLVYPPLDDVPGRLMFDPDVMFPKYCKNAESVTADFDPTVPLNKKQMGKSDDTKRYIDDHSYFYLGYIVSNETELLALAEAYRTYTQLGQVLPGEIPVKKGTGSFGSDTLLRLCEPNIAVAALAAHGVPKDGLLLRLGSVPVFIERPGHYRKSGGWVEFLAPTPSNAHAEFMQYPGKFPMTQVCIDALMGLDALKPRSIQAKEPDRAKS